MERGIVAGDVEYAQRLLQAHTEQAKVVQALIYRGLAPEVAERLVKDLKEGREINELDGPKAEEVRRAHSPEKQSPTVQPGPPPARTPARGVRWVVILPLLLALALGVSVAWWRKAAATRHAQELAAQQAEAEAQSRRLAEANASVPSVVAQANDCLRAGKVAAGLKLVDELLAVVDAPELQEVKVDLLIKGNRVNEAYQLLLQLLEKQPEDAHLHFKAGLLAETVKGPGEAASQFAEASRLVPENKAYRVAWAKECLKTGASDQVKLAVENFKTLLDSDEQSTTTWLDYAGALFASGQRTEAINLLSQAARRFPDQSVYPFALAKVTDSIGSENGDSAKLQIAASYYLESLRLRPRKNSLAAKRYYEITGNRVPPEYEGIRTDEISLERQGNRFFVYANINNVSGRFVVDTGATSAAIAAGSLARFNLAPTKAGLAQTAAGVVRTYLAYADITLGKYTLRNALIGIVPASFGPNCDGLLGLDTLRALNANLDASRGLLLIQGEQPEVLFGD